MQKHPTTMGQIIIWGLLAFGLIILNGGSVVGDNPPASRWAKVDLTQYCGRTVGELIDAVGTDYVMYKPISYDHDLGGFDFGYSDEGYPDVIISVYPTNFEYCDNDLRKGTPKMQDIRREHIAIMRLRTGR